MLSEIQKGVFPIQISFKYGIKNLVKFVGRDSMTFINKLAIHRLDNRGNVKWKKVIGKRKSVYFSHDMKVNELDETCILSYVGFGSIPSPNTLILKLDSKGKIIYDSAILKKFFEQIHVDNENNFQFIGSGAEWKSFEKDSLFIISLSQNNELKTIFEGKSIFDEISITSFGWDDISKSYFVGGYGVNSKTKGTVWESHNDNWIGRISLENNAFFEWTNKKEGIDRIHDLAISDKYIFTTGESRDGNVKKMRLLKIE